MNEPKFCNQCGGSLQPTKRHPGKICIKCMKLYSTNSIMDISLIKDLRAQINELQMKIRLAQLDCDHEFMQTLETRISYHDTGYGERKVTEFKSICPYCESIKWR